MSIAVDDTIKKLNEMVRDTPRVTPPLAPAHYQRIINATTGSGSHVLRWLAVSPYFFPANHFEDPAYYEDFIGHMNQLIPLLIEQKTLSVTTFQDFLEPIARIDDLVRETIIYGIALYFSKEYLACIYVLTLQLEDTLRILLLLHNGEVYEATKNGREKRPLGRVMQDLQPLLPSGFYHYAMWLLKDRSGLRLRDNIAHGLFKTNNAQPLYAVTLIHLICIINVLIDHELERKSAVNATV